MVDFVIVGGVAFIAGIIIGYVACLMAVSIICEDQEIEKEEEE